MFYAMLNIHTYKILSKGKSINLLSEIIEMLLLKSENPLKITFLNFELEILYKFHYF